MLNVNLLPVIVDNDLELQRLEDRYARALFTLIHEDREYLRQWQNWPDRIRTLSDMRTLIYKSERKRLSNNGFDAAILYKGQPVGKIGLVYIDWIARQTEIGYWLGEEYQGRGLMTRACRVLVDHALLEMQLNQVNIRCAAENIRSAAIPQRLGFVYDGTQHHKVWLHGEMHDELTFTMTATHWKQHMIYHITTKQAWEDAHNAGEYRATSLETQGFIHLSTKEQITKVANAVYTGQGDLILLCVEPNLLAADALRYEPPDTTVPAAHDDGERFPHLYSALPLNAVLRVLDFPPGKDGRFVLPDELA